MDCLLRFPRASAPGFSGLRPQHLKDLAIMCHNMRSQVTSFVNFVMNNDIPSLPRSSFFGANLIAFKKKDGGLRPIAVGETLRRLAVKCAASKLSAKCAEVLFPVQLGVGVPGGIEAAIHSAHAELHQAPSDICVLKLDFSNAFNTIRRDLVAHAVVP